MILWRRWGNDREFPRWGNDRESEKERLEAAAMTTAMIRARVALLTAQVHSDLQRLPDVLSDVFVE